MFHKEKQVALTYLTLKGVWWILPTSACITLGLMFNDSIPPVFVLGLLCMLGLVWVIAIVKWQFINPRARLTPGFSKPHLLLFAAISSVLLIINPLLLSFAHGISPLGPLAFTLSFSGCWLVVLLLKRDVALLPGILIFVSGLASQTTGFWFGSSTENAPLHYVLILTGCSTIGYCFWFLTQLTEEMDQYQIMPMGNISNLSRIERIEQRRLIGRAVKKNRWTFAFTDQWLDQSFQKINPTQRNIFLAEFSFAAAPCYFAAIVTCIGFVTYSIVMLQFDFFRFSTPQVGLIHPPGILIGCTVCLPAVMVGMTQLQNVPRIGQELLRPASRADYFDNLFLSLTKRNLAIWTGLFVGLYLLAYLTSTLPRENTTLLILKFALLSLSSQLLAFGFSLRFALWKSFFGFIFAFYAVVILQMTPIWYWWTERGNDILFPVILILNLLLGSWVITWVRKKWNQAEFG